MSPSKCPTVAFSRLPNTAYRRPIDAVLEPIAVAMKNEYPEVEIEELDSLDDDSDSIEFRFYYLDLLIVARVIAMVIDENDARDSGPSGKPRL
jgi:hypothetical protein